MTASEFRDRMNSLASFSLASMSRAPTPDEYRKAARSFVSCAPFVIEPDSREAAVVDMDLAMLMAIADAGLMSNADYIRTREEAETNVVQLRPSDRRHAR